jgi:ribosomal protein L11 methyltransferase
MTNYIQLTFKVPDLPGKEILIAQLANIGFEGFEDGSGYLNACIPEDLFDENAIRNAIDFNKYPFTLEVIEPKNWNEDWERSFEPVIVGDFCAIRAGFHTAVPNVKNELIITPKMSFGTGHHATTFLVVQLMETIDFAGKKVLDFGTGTGVLAILAEKLKAGEVTAIDYDDWSITNAGENIIQNKCSRITLEKADGIYRDEIYDIILANINKNVILQNLPALAKHLCSNGVLIVSGLLKTDYHEIVEYARLEQFVLQKEVNKTEWIALHFSYGNAAKNNPIH